MALWQISYVFNDEGGRPRAVNCLQHTDKDVATGILDACVEARRGEGLARRLFRIQVNAGGQRGIV
eukprot:1817826-Lingulodinium_polyedra.AAC.1